MDTTQVNTILTAENLSCHSGRQRRLAVAEIHVEAGKLIGITGPNGAGKSTLLNALGGELACQGELLFHGRSLPHWPPLQRARHLAMLPQSSQVGFSFNALEIVALGLIPLSLSRRDGQREIHRVMVQTDCQHLAYRPFPTLSGGERQRVQLARVLLQLSQAEQPPLLLLDEPTSAQDLKQQHTLLTLAKTLASKHHYAVVAVLHDLNHVLRYCDHCVLMKSGELAQQGNPLEILTSDTIESHWGYRAKMAGHLDALPVFV